MSDRSGGGVGEGAAWPPGLAPLVSTEPIKGGFICTTIRGRLADGREVVVKRCPYPAEVEADGLAALAAAGIPVGGLFTGAGEAKSEREEDQFGGTAGQPADPCYHQRCDDLGNLDLTVLDQMADAAAHAVATFANDTTPVDRARG